MLLLELVRVNLSPISISNLQLGSSTFKSCHPSHTKSSVIFSQALRIRRICSKRSDLIANVTKLKDWFRERGYLQDTVYKKTKRALETPSVACSKISERSVPGKSRTGVPLVVNYKLFLRRLGEVIRRNLYFLYQDQEVKQVFTPTPFIPFQSVRTLKSHVIKAKSYRVRETSYLKKM